MPNKQDKTGPKFRKPDRAMEPSKGLNIGNAINNKEETRVTNAESNA